MIPGVEEVGKTTRSFFDALKDQPLSLALVAMNVFLIGLLYYSTVSAADQRRETAGLIIKWQQDTDKLMANCVSQDVTKMVLDNVQKVTETMLATAAKDLDRMQKAIDQERELNRKLVEDSLKRFQRYVPPPGLPFKRDAGAPEGGD